MVESRTNNILFSIGSILCEIITIFFIVMGSMGLINSGGNFYLEEVIGGYLRNLLLFFIINTIVIIIVIYNWKKGVDKKKEGLLIFISFFSNIVMVIALITFFPIIWRNGFYEWFLYFSTYSVIFVALNSITFTCGLLKFIKS